METIQENNTYIKLAKGVLISFVTTLVGIFIFALVLNTTSLSESTTPIVILGISFISILLGATISTRKLHKHGMLHGGIIGGTYIALLYIISSTIHTGFTVNIYTIMMIIAGIIAGLLGGILGINS